MSVPDRSIDPRLLTAAKNEFLEKGFKNASLARICEAAGVTTGALYKRYSGKEELFSALVSETVENMAEYVSGIKEKDLTGITDQELYDSFLLKPETNREWLRFLYDHREGFTLLIRCASGTRYENFHQEWTEKMNDLDYKYFQEAKRRGLITKDITSEELHVLTYSVWALYYEPFYLDFTWEQIEKHAEYIYRFTDWHNVLEMKKTE